MALVQNKVDLIDQAAINSDEAEAMARKLNVKFYRACVKDNLNVAEGQKPGWHVFLAQKLTL